MHKRNSQRKKLKKKGKNKAQTNNADYKASKALSVHLRSNRNLPSEITKQKREFSLRERREASLREKRIGG